MKNIEKILEGNGYEITVTFTEELSTQLKEVYKDE